MYVTVRTEIFAETPQINREDLSSESATPETRFPAGRGEAGNFERWLWPGWPE